MEDDAGMDWDWYYEKHNRDEEASPQEELESEIESFEKEEVN